MQIQKKGISPLIATILIIGFTVALAAVIMTWGSSFTKTITQGTEETTNEQLVCAQDVLFTITDACSGLDKINITISNDGSKKIESFTARYYIANDNVKANTFLSLDPFVVKTYTNGSTLVGIANTVKRVELIPIVKVDANLITCPNTIETFGDTDLVNGLPLRAC